MLWSVMSYLAKWLGSQEEQSAGWLLGQRRRRWLNTQPALWMQQKTGQQSVLSGADYQIAKSACEGVAPGRIKVALWHRVWVESVPPWMDGVRCRSPRVARTRPDFIVQSPPPRHPPAPVSIPDPRTLPRDPDLWPRDPGYTPPCPVSFWHDPNCPGHFCCNFHLVR